MQGMEVSPFQLATLVCSLLQAGGLGQPACARGGGFTVCLGLQNITIPLDGDDAAIRKYAQQVEDLKQKVGYRRVPCCCCVLLSSSRISSVHPSSPVWMCPRACLHACSTQDRLRSQLRQACTPPTASMQCSSLAAAPVGGPSPEHSRSHGTFPPLDLLAISQQTSPTLLDGWVPPYML